MTEEVTEPTEEVTEPTEEFQYVEDDHVLVVEDTELPRRLKDRIYEVIEAREGVTVDQADEIARATETRYLDTRVDPLDPVGTVSAQSIGEPGTQMTMNTFHYAGVAEIDVTQGLPRLIELVDARKTPDTPMMTVYLDPDYIERRQEETDGLSDREIAHEVVWQIEATKILSLGDVSTNVADMLVQIELDEDTLLERWPRADNVSEVAEEIAETIEDALGVETTLRGTLVEFGPEKPSYRRLLQLVEELRDIVFKGIEEVSRVVIRRENIDDTDEEEFILYTEGSAFGDVLHIEGVDASRSTSNNIHEVYEELGVEAAREAIIDETMDTLREQGLDDVNVRHLMLVSDIMTNRGTIESIGRHGISGSKESVLARAAFEVTVNHLLDAAIMGESDDLDGVIENVIVGKPVAIGTGDVDLKMGSIEPATDGGPETVDSTVVDDPDVDPTTDA